MMNWLRLHKKQLRNWLIGIGMVCLAFFIWYTAALYRQRKAAEAVLAAAQEESASQAAPASSASGENGKQADGEFPDFSQDTVTWQGRTYRRNTYVKAILCMGIDRSDEMTGTRERGYAGQSDGMFLIAHDTARNQIQILMLPRDTMTEITVTDENQQEIGRQVDHLTLAFAYGDGQWKSCEYASEAVTGLLFGLPMDRFMAVDTSVIAVLNDGVGGVSVTMPDDAMVSQNPAYGKGAQVTLHGKEAEAFIRYRDIGKDNTALFRMDRHQEYITRFFQTLKEKSARDSQIVPRLFDQIQDHMLTDMPKEEYLKMALDVLGGSNLDSGSFYTLPGMGSATDTYDEYYVNKQQTVPVLLKLFYRETS